ncbi:MAG: polysaccharide deacetylase family protein [Anaerolineaceae bacterium]|nr:polysaccharide deacetylase family protein [Anaerolineaceae bacterium]
MTIQKDDLKDNKAFYLSFDGSPNPPATDRLLKCLSNYGIQATFFMEGRRLETEADCARRVQAAGHDIGNHSYNHPEFDKIPIQDCIREVAFTQAIIHKELGFFPTLLRPPAGLLTKEVEDTFLALGFDIVLWSYSVRDWEGPDAKSVSQRILSQAVPGAIIALHDRTEWLIEILDIIVPRLTLDRYTFRKISQNLHKGVIKIG